MKQIKRIISCLLVVAITCSCLATSAFASTNKSDALKHVIPLNQNNGLQLLSPNISSELIDAKIHTLSGKPNSNKTLLLL